jgi:PAS domain S-box-containing protein
MHSNENNNLLEAPKDKFNVNLNDPSEARFRAMFDTAVVGIGMMSLDRVITDANPAMCRMLGMERDEIIGRTPTFLTYPEDVQEATSSFEDLMAGKKESYSSERRYVRKDGEVFWAHVTISIVRGQGGEPLYMIGMVIDTNEQKRALFELAESEKRFRAMFENAGIGIALINTERQALAVNDSLVRISGYTREELLSKNGYNLSHPDDREVGIREYRELVAGRLDSYPVQRRYLRKDGKPYWVQQTISAVRDNFGQLSYLVAMVEDIDQQKQDQERLRESEARFRAVFDNAAIGVAVISLEGFIIQSNQTFTCLTGYLEEDLVEAEASLLFVEGDRPEVHDLFSSLATGERDQYLVEKRFIRKDQSIFWGRANIALVRDAGNQPFYIIGMVEDITEQVLSAEKLAAQEAEDRRTLEQRVEERTRELRETNLRLVSEIEHRQRAEQALARKAVEGAVSAERTRLARDLHDAVTQTLFSASLIAEVLPDLWDLDEAEARRSSDELRQLTRGALAEMRTLLLELRPTALTQARFPDLIKQLTEAVIGRARLPIDLVVEGEYELPVDVKVALYRIAQESLNNIVKYARASQVKIYLTLEPSRVHLEIRDNGAGFEITSIKPTSLGMRIMRERADSIQAQFQVASIPGGGTTVKVDWIEGAMPPFSQLLT